MSDDRFRTRVDVPLVGDVDFEACLRGIPAEFMVKGMFFTRYVNALEAAWEKMASSLDAPARHGRYHAFESYPMRDYMRLFDRVARERFPGSTREAYRLVSRGEIEVFAESTLGKVAFSLVGDPGAALLRYPDLLAAVTRGPSVAAQKRDAKHVVMIFDRVFGTPEQVMGLVEGLVLMFEETPALEATVGDPERMTLDVRW